MKVKAEATPVTKGIENCLQRVDFKDTFSTTNHVDSIEDVALLIFQKAPAWIDRLMKMRNAAVKLIGLKTEAPADYKPSIEVGGYIGFFKIIDIYDNEIIMGVDDKHLNFRVSVYDSKETEFNIKISTLVEYNNRFGKVYMFFVKPFHRVVVKVMVKQAYRK